MNAILQVENLTKQYADFKLDHVSFSVPKGTIMGLIGENGAGKSTTINAILDLIHKDDGTVTFWGQELSSTKQIKEDVGVAHSGQSRENCWCCLQTVGRPSVSRLSKAVSTSSG